jgi:NarL family two-component system response regulator LiaR
VLKDVRAMELANVVRKAAQGEAVLHPHVALRLMQEINGSQRQEANPLADLSEREIEVLRLVAEGLNNAEIAGRLTISEKTVKSHVSNILGKLHLADRTQAAVYAWREGIMRQKS